MPKARKKLRPNGPCALILSRDMRWTLDVMGHAEALALDVTAVDLHEDRVHGNIWVKTRIGKRIYYPSHLPGSGDVTLPLRECLMAGPGVSMTRRSISGHTGIPNLADRVNFASRLRTIRPGLGDDGKPGKQWYIRTLRGSRVMWIPERSYRVILDNPGPELTRFIELIAKVGGHWLTV